MKKADAPPAVTAKPAQQKDEPTVPSIKGNTEKEKAAYRSRPFTPEV